MIRSEPLLGQLDSVSDPKSSVPIEGSAGRATGRVVPNEVEGVDIMGSTAAGFAAGLAAARRVVVRLAGARFAVVRLAVDFLPPVRFAVVRRAVVRFAVDFLPPARFAVERLAVDFLVDFFFAAI